MVFVTHITNYLDTLRRSQDLLLPSDKEKLIIEQCKINSHQSEILYLLVVHAYVDPMVGLILRGTTTRHIAKSILWFVYPSYELENTVDKLFKELDMKIFPSAEEEEQQCCCYLKRN